MIDYATEDKAIYVNYPANGSTGMGFFLKPLRNNRTRVDYVSAGFSGSLYHQGIIDSTVDEVAYFLGHGQQAYREYTHTLKEQWHKKLEEESRSKHRSAFE